MLFARGVEMPFVKARIAEYPDTQKAYDEMAATQAVGRMSRLEEIAAAVFYDPAVDLAFCLNHLLLKSIHRPRTATEYISCFRELAGRIWGPSVGNRRQS
jgi:hypothetical protein